MYKPYWITPDLSKLFVRTDVPSNAVIHVNVYKQSGFAPNGDSTFIYFDDFNDGEIDPNKWTVELSGSASVTEENGYVDLRTSGPSTSRAYLYSQPNVLPDKSIVIEGSAIVLTTNSYKTNASARIFIYNSDKSAFADGRLSVRSGVIVANAGSNDNGASKSFTGNRTEWSTVGLISEPTQTTYVYGDQSVSVSESSDWTQESDSFALYNFFIDGQSGTSRTRWEWISVRKRANVVATVTDMGAHYQIKIHNNENTDITDFTLELDASELNISNDAESLCIVQSGVLSGNVIKDGQYLEGAKVTAINSEMNSIVDTVITDQDGFYAIAPPLGITGTSEYWTTAHEYNNLTLHPSNIELYKPSAIELYKPSALLFDGADDRVDLGNVLNELFTTNTFTIEAWCKLNSYTDHDGYDGILIQKWYTSSSSSNCFILRPWWFNTQGGGVQIDKTSTPLNTWVHVAAVMDGGDMYLYNDGVLVGSGTSGHCNTCSYPLRIGNLWNNHYDLDGNVADVRIWSTPRTGEEINSNKDQPISPDTEGLVAYLKLDDAEGTSVKDYTGSYNGAITGATWVHDSPFAVASTGYRISPPVSLDNIPPNHQTSINWDAYDPNWNRTSLVFDGTDDCVVISEPNMDNSGNGIISGWVRASEVPTTQCGLFGYEQNYSNNTGFHIRITNSSTVELVIGDGSTTRYLEWDHPDIFDNMWHKLTGEYDGIKLKIYRDDELVLQADTDDFNIAVSRNQFYIGKYRMEDMGSDYFFKGEVSEVYAEKNGQKLGEWKLDENTGTTAYDSTNNGNNGSIFGALWNHEAIETYVNIDCALTDSSSLQPSTWYPAVNGDPIPCIAPQQDLRGKYLWLKQSLETRTDNVSPKLYELTTTFDYFNKYHITCEYGTYEYKPLENSNTIHYDEDWQVYDDKQYVEVKDGNLTIENMPLLEFDGVDDYVGLPNITIGSQLTVEFLSRSNGPHNGTNGTPGPHANNGDVGFRFYESDSGDINAWWRKLDGNVESFDSSATTIPGEFKHIALTHSGSTAKLYVNGILKSQKNSTSLNTGSAASYINRHSEGGYIYNGNTAEVRVWNTERTQQQLQDNMYSSMDGTESGLVAYYPLDENEGTVVYDHAGSNNGTIYGATWNTLNYAYWNNNTGFIITGPIALNDISSAIQSVIKWEETHHAEKDVSLSEQATPTTSSDPTTGSRNMLNDGDKNSSNYMELASGNAEWAGLDLGETYTLNQIKVWHYYTDSRTYNDTKVEVSTDGENWDTVFDSDIDGTYTETSSGKTHTLDNIKARYIRDWVNGSNKNTCNHWVEIEVYGDLSTYLNVSTALVAQGVQPGEDDWQNVSNDGSIPQINEGMDLTGYELYIRQTLYTQSNIKTPELNSLSVYINHEEVYSYYNAKSYPFVDTEGGT